MEKYKKMLSICGKVKTTNDYKEIIYNHIKENQDAVKKNGMSGYVRYSYPV